MTVKFSKLLMLSVLIVGISVAFFFTVGNLRDRGWLSESRLQETENEFLITQESLFPENFPLHDAFELRDKSVIEEKQVASFVFISQLPPREVFEFFKPALAKEGWVMGNTLENEDFFSLNFENDLHKGFLGITKDDSGETLISVTMGARYVQRDY